MRRHWPLPMALYLALAMAASAQQSDTSKTGASPASDEPVANPGRPTVSTPATLTPVGYFQFETGVLAAWHSPGLSSQTSINEVIKFSVSRWIELLVSSQPYAHTSLAGPSSNDPGDVALGVQAVLHHGEGANPTIAVSYFGVPYNGDAPSLDTGSFQNSVLLLASADIEGFHFDNNYFFNQAIDGPVRRAQFGQTLSVYHDLGKNFGIAGEIWHFTQPFLHGNAVGNLWALDYNARKDLVFDCGFNRGFTSTSTRWEVFAGFTYLLPRKVRMH